MSNDQLTAGWKAAIVASLALGLIAVGLSAVRGPAGGPESGVEGRVASLEGRIKAMQAQPAKAGARPDDRGQGE